MKHETSVALHDYWQSRHGRAGAPAGQIRAAELAPLLASLFLLEFDLSAGPRFRFCGAAISARYGRDLANEDFLTLWNSSDRPLVERHLRIVSMRSAGLVAGVMGETVGGGFTAFEMVILPLAGESGTAGAIGSMARIGGHDELNRIHARLVAQSLHSSRFLPAAGHSVERTPALAMRAAPEFRPPEARRRYRHLTLLPGGKRSSPCLNRAPLTDN